MHIPIEEFERGEVELVEWISWVGEKKGVEEKMLKYKQRREMGINE
jgi:hypothetical protein